MEYDQNWQQKYEDMISTPARALSHVQSGQRVFIGTGCAEPVQLVAAMTRRAGGLADVELVQLITKGRRPMPIRCWPSALPSMLFLSVPMSGI